jgi:hypothetical protein
MTVTLRPHLAQTDLRGRKPPAIGDALGEAVCARHDEPIAAFLKREANSPEEAKAIISVAQVWEDALRAVDAELGGANARPMSAAVKQVIASRLGLSITRVDTAMHRLKHAVRRVRALEIESRASRLNSGPQ